MVGHVNVNDDDDDGDDGEKCDRKAPIGGGK